MDKILQCICGKVVSRFYLIVFWKFFLSCSPFEKIPKNVDFSNFSPFVNRRDFTKIYFLGGFRSSKLEHFYKKSVQFSAKKKNLYYFSNFLFQGETKILLTKIPHYREVIIMSFKCEHCGYQNNEIQSGSQVQDQGIKFKVKIQTSEDLCRQIVKSDYATLTVPEIELEIPPNSQKGGK